MPPMMIEVIVASPVDRSQVVFEDDCTRPIWDDRDSGALEAGIASTNSDLPSDTWFVCPAVGSPALTLRIAHDRDAWILSMIIGGEFDAPVLGARFDSLLDHH